MSRSALGFDDSDSGSESDSSSKVLAPSRALLQQRQRANKHIAAQQAANARVPAVEEDARVYEYDEVYDSIQESRNSKLRKLGGNSSDKGAKYIGNLLEAKKKREEDRLRVQELKIQRERELEGDEFKGKEEFVTSGYKEYREKMNKADIEEQEQEEKRNMKEFHRSRLDLENEGSNDGGNGSRQSNRGLETQKALQQIEQLESTTEPLKPKFRLLPRLPDSEIEAARERYYERRRLQTTS